ncbi:hypothetical protein Back11_26470 [Paenibacillus baekrokdamisoli]|uniref:Uncharacterized protein n=1 Tax=Paenibacillus baekrokdamisoli TaxID=1712516 RepID=A0A3G9IST9_9BACL|nr:helix-turn-helix domain-containing protein [Paenibacillus baekrokdamisoli]MBB3070297.1 AraC-like DNA-binding protein/quercetin dioxygenase-like cupin family protein [Paenibacillus baekrokdamisoli]BBH21302.1 hypothetical protein Back11_26470 [Paenibacillus baekrokdamisoli]
MAEYLRTKLKPLVLIHNLITMYYFEFAKDYVFHGESHDFWELVYTDKGEVEVTADTSQHRLESGSIIFHKPNEFHSFYASGGTAPNIIVISFDTKSKVMKQFENRIQRLDDAERNLLSEIIREAMQTFMYPFEHPLILRDNPLIGGEQMIRSLLEQFLIRLLRSDNRVLTGISLLSVAQEIEKHDLKRAVIQLMQERIRESLSLEDISLALRLTKTKLKDDFKKQTGYPVMKYFMRLKIDMAKMQIRETKGNFSEIAEDLGFRSVHSFSKAFKKTIGMTPTEYARSVQARI